VNTEMYSNYKKIYTLPVCDDKNCYEVVLT
jgi:hypothetical protein